MYNLNYIDGLVTKEKYGSVFVRCLKLFNFFVHIAIVLLLVLTVLVHIQAGEYDKKTEITKQDIEQKRTTTRIREIETEWETLYYKILAIKTQMREHTNYAYALRDFGLYLPSENAIINVSLNGPTSTTFMTISNDTLAELTSFYDYTSILNSSLEKSSYLGHEVIIQDLEERKVEKTKVKALKVEIPLSIRNN